MDILNLINCDNDNILHRESKMIANLLLSGTDYQSYSYKQVSDKIYEHYHCYIRFNRYDKFANNKENVAKRDVGYYAGEISKLCCKLGYPLLSVNILNQTNDMPEQGFYDLCDRLNVLMGKTKVERKKIMRDLIAKNFEQIKETLPKFLNGETTEEKITPLIKNANEANTAKPELVEVNNIIKEDDKFEYTEGLIKEIKLLQKTRNKEIVNIVKTKENYTCQGCGFNYDNQIVQVHHLVPLSEHNEEYQIKEKNLITLCPNCHAISHLLLKTDEKYKNKENLVMKLKAIHKGNE